jgi:hypothetical protein
MSTDPSHIEREPLAGLVIFTSDGRAQFGWQNPETGQFFAEADGSYIVNAVGAVAWASDRMH